MPGYVANYDGSAVALIMGGTSFSFPTAPATQGDVFAYHVASAALLPTVRAWGIGTTSTVGIALANTTAAADGAQQYSPALHLGGRGWKSNATATSQAVDWRIYVVPVQGATAATSTLYFDHSTAGGAFSNQMNLTSGGALTTLGAITASGAVGQSGHGLYLNTNLNSGLGATDAIRAAADRVWLLLQLGRSDGAGNIVTANCYDRNAASITNTATMFNSLVSWTNNSDAISHQIAGYYTGALWLAAGGKAAAPGVHHGSGITFGNFNEEVVLGDAATDHDTTAQVPAGATILIAPTKVTEASTNAVTYSVGIAGATTQFGTGLNAQSTSTTSVGGGTPLSTAAATSIRITTSGVPGADGKIRVTCFWFVGTAPTS